jgi:hypothetical protein
VKVTRDQVLRFRHHAQGLAGGVPSDDAAILDLGVQDTGMPQAARWALDLRGCHIPDEELTYAWTVRGAPHAYRRREIAEVAAATAPYEEADAAKRVFDAARPLKAADIAVLDALEEIADQLRDIVRESTVKGEVSAELTRRLDDPYLRTCRPCQAIHAYEQPFRFACLRAGLELEPDTSPPVLRPIPGWQGPAARCPAHLDPVRAALRLLGPATPKLVAGYLDAPAKVVTAHWPQDVVRVEVDGTARDILAEDADVLAAPPRADGVVRLLGAFDLFLQSRDRELIVPVEARRRQLWRTLGRPGAVLIGHEIAGTWRLRSSGRKLRLAVDLWDGSDRPDTVDDEAERLAAFRGQTFGGYTDA